MRKSKQHQHGPSSKRDGGRAAGWDFPRGIALQLLAILGLSSVLGFTFNAASPVGVRFGEPTSPTAATAPVATSIIQPASPIPAPPLSKNLGDGSAAKPTTDVGAAPAVTPTLAQTPWSVTHPQALPHSGGAAPAPVPAANPSPIHWPEAKALAAARRAVLVDVRAKAMFDAGHIPGAISLPELSAPDEFRTFLSQQPTNLVVIVYCSSTSCSQSARVANRLVLEFHWPAVRYMTGGYLEYQQAELAPRTPPPPP